MQWRVPAQREQIQPIGELLSSCCQLADLIRMKAIDRKDLGKLRSIFDMKQLVEQTRQKYSVFNLC